MAKKDDFDKIDSNKDGFISREEYANADKSAGVKKEKLNWFLRLITLGDRFDIQDFWDRLKKSIVEFIILVFGVTVSFGIEQQGGESDNRADGIENLLNLREEIDKMIAYTDTYIEQVDWVSALYQKQYDKWELDNDSVFMILLKTRKNQMENIILLQWECIDLETHMTLQELDLIYFQEGLKIFF